MKPKITLQVRRRHHRMVRNETYTPIIWVATFCLLAMPVMHAQIWDGGGADNNLLTPGNWVGNVAPVSNLSTTNLIFHGNDNIDVSLTNPFSANKISFDSTSDVFSLSGSTFNIGLGGIENNSSVEMRFFNSIDFSGVATSTINADLGGLFFGRNENIAGDPISILMPSDSLTLSGSGVVRFGRLSLSAGVGQSLQVNTNLESRAQMSFHSDPLQGGGCLLASGILLN